MRQALHLAVEAALVCFVCLGLLAGCRGGRLPERRGSHGVYHEVQRGQTLWGIARAYGVNMKMLSRVNKLANTDVLHVGQRLYIPGARRRRQVARQCPCRTQDETPSEKRAASGPASRTARTSSVPGRHTAARPALFIWPVQGTVTRRFKQSGKHRHDGIDIAASKGTPIRAVADGKVIFSDWGPGGYGRLVILRHKANMVTVYAHNHRNLVHVGRVVQRGDHIATVGKSGRATGYHLHFEIRRKTVPVSPFKYLTRNQRLVRLNDH